MLDLVVYDDGAENVLTFSTLSFVTEFLKDLISRRENNIHNVTTY
jgi:hypothetical protein